jgi:hypothetical protein
MQIRSVGIDLGKTTFHLGSFVVQVESVFQSTPSRGGRPALKYQEPQPGCFNPRPRAGGDDCNADIYRGPSRFNPRPRARGDFR